MDHRRLYRHGHTQQHWYWQLTALPPPDFAELNDEHLAIGGVAVNLLRQADATWSDCRLLVQWFDYEDDSGHATHRRFMYLDDGVAKSAGAWPAESEELLESYRSRFNEITGQALARFRMEIKNDGSFEVLYFYDNVRGTPTWVWPDEEGYLSSRELRERGFRPF